MKANSIINQLFILLVLVSCKKNEEHSTIVDASSKEVTTIHLVTQDWPGRERFSRPGVARARHAAERCAEAPASAALGAEQLVDKEHGTKDTTQEARGGGESVRCPRADSG